MVNSFLFVVIIRLDRIIHSSLTWIPAFAGMTTARSTICLSQFFHNRFLNILKSGFAAKYSVVNSYIRGFNGISLMTKPKQTGINRFHFYIIGIFLFDFHGQSTEIGSPFSGRAIGINCYLDHDGHLLFLELLFS